MLFINKAKVLEGLLSCLNPQLVHSQTTENKDSVDLGSSATTVLLYKIDPIEQYDIAGVLQLT